MTEWVSTSTAELIETRKLEIGDGYRAKNSEFGEHGIPFLRIGNLREGRLLLDGADLYPEENLAKVAGKVSRSKDCVIATKATIGRLAYLDESTPQVLYSPQVSYWRVLDESVLEPRFIRCWLVGREFDVQAFQTKSSTSMADYINLRDQRRMRMTLPPLDIQRKIASVVTAYDELIENNLRRIEILEEMAKAVYREWFVNLRFLGREEVALVDSPLGPIPEGWEASVVDEAFDILGGATPSTKRPDFWHEGTINWYTPSDLTGHGHMFIEHSSRQITPEGLASCSATLFPAGSVMMTSRATLGVIAINLEPACTNQGFITCVPNERVSAAHLYFWIKSNIPLIESLASGATFKEITKRAFRQIEFLIPSHDVGHAFADVVEPMLSLIANLIRQNANLRATRDLLLPKLVSGEVDVSDLDIDTEWLAS